MTRSRLASSSSFARAAMGLWVLGLAACSINYQAGSAPPATARKPARTSAPETKGKGTPSTKPIAKTDPAPSEPAPSEPTSTNPTRKKPTRTEGPTRTPPRTEEPPPVVGPQTTAVCRIEDEALLALCHRAFDPIAADDLDGFVAQLGEGVVLTRPTHQAGAQRLRGPEAVRTLATKNGGLRELLHLRPTDRVVGTVTNDCRQCRRSIVALEANTRSGTVVVTFDMTQPPSISTVEIASQVRRRHLGTALDRDDDPTPKPRPTPTPKDEPAPSKPPATIVPPKDEPTPSEPPTTIVPPKAEPEPDDSPELVAPPPTRKKRPVLKKQE